MKKMLIVGNADAYWFKYYVEHVALPLGYDVSIQLEPGKKCKFLDFYKANNVQAVGEYKLNSFIMNVPKVRAKYMEIKRATAIKREFDVVVVVSTTLDNLTVAKAAVKRDGKIVALVIGSDVLRVSKFYLNRLDGVLSALKATVICSAIEPWHMIDKTFVKTKCPRSHVIGMGLPNLNAIDKLIHKGAETCKAELGIDPQKVTICVGYNARPEQQHEKIIEAVATLDEKVKNQIHMVLPMTYLGNHEYRDGVERLLQEKKLDYSILQDYRDADGMAQLWIACDVFINAQTTDAMSASLLECIYAGTEILNGEWLKYKELEKIQIELKTFATFEELSGMLEDAMKNKNIRNRLYTEKMGGSVERCRNNWKAVFDSLEV